MTDRLERVKQHNPKAAQRDDVKEVAKDIDTYAAIAGFASSEAGKLLIEAQMRSILITIDAIASDSRTLHETELRILAIKLNTQLDFARSLTRARTNLELAEDYLQEKLIS